LIKRNTQSFNEVSGRLRWNFIIFHFISYDETSIIKPRIIKRIRYSKRVEHCAGRSDRELGSEMIASYESESDLPRVRLAENFNRLGRFLPWEKYTRSPTSVVEARSLTSIMSRCVCLREGTHRRIRMILEWISLAFQCRTPRSRNPAILPRVNTGTR
jgi:hypothetical protein